MTSFVALYRGESVREAKMIAITGDHRIIGIVAGELLHDPYQRTDTGDPVLEAMDNARSHALRLVKDEADNANGPA